MLFACARMLWPELGCRLRAIDSLVLRIMLSNVGVPTFIVSEFRGKEISPECVLLHCTGRKREGSSVE